jgi:hypothetical protein
MNGTFVLYESGVTPLAEKPLDCLTTTGEVSLPDCYLTPAEASSFGRTSFRRSRR